jgi:hypothetical protein
MKSEYLAAIQIVLFVLLVAAYFFIATRVDVSKSLKVKEVLVLYSTTLLFAFSKTITSLMFILTATAIIVFNLNKAKAKRNGKRNKGFVS